MNRNHTIEKKFGFNPRADIPRASFRMNKRRTMTMGVDNVTPIFCVEVLPTDRWNFTGRYFGRLLTPIFPLMNDLWLEVFYFYVPARILWSHWQNFITGKNPDPTDSTTYTIPKVAMNPLSTYAAPGTLWDHLALPVYGQPNVIAGALGETVSALPFRAYASIWNEWFRDPYWVQPKMGYVGPGLQGDGPDSNVYLLPNPRYKKKDYFTGTLPWPQAASASVPIMSDPGANLFIQGQGTNAPIFTQGANALTLGMSNGTAATNWSAAPTATGAAYWSDPKLQITGAALSSIIGTINTFRTAMQTQKVLERDARSGPRYPEMLQGHFGIMPLNAELQRPEYLGSAKKNLTMHSVPQTSGTSVTGSDTPLGELAAFVTVSMNADIHCSIPEHGYIMGVANISGDISYQQGIPKHFSRQTRYDYYLPAFAMLGEQAVLTKEIYSTLNAMDTTIFGYIPRWDDMRYWPDEITGDMRSGVPNTLDAWHLAESFATTPTNGATFMQQNTPIARIVADDTTITTASIKLDIVHNGVVARPLPMYSVPGLVDHF